MSLPENSVKLEPKPAGVIEGDFERTPWSVIDPLAGTAVTSHREWTQTSKIAIEEKKPWWVIYTTDADYSVWHYHGSFLGETPEAVLDICHVPTKATAVYVIPVGLGVKFVRGGWERE